jgi:hypothetical protein
MTVAEGAIKKLDAHVWEREADEHYVEPSWCSRRLFDVEEFNDQVWDPCCGFGTIVLNAMHQCDTTYASDIVERKSGICDEVCDFLKCTDNCAAPNIVCNPPFNIAGQFALHALSLKNTKKVAMIFPVARLNAAHWIKGTPLRRVWLMTPRPSMPPGHVIARGEKPGGGKMDFCWLVWERGYDGSSELKWLTREPR